MVDFYVTNPNYNYLPDTLIEGYKSMIWTERYNASGDFQLTLPRSHPLASSITSMDFIVKNDSLYFMQVEDIAKDTSAGTVTFTGRTGDNILNYRPTVKGTLWPNWAINGRPTQIAMTLVRNAIDPAQVYYSEMGFPNITFADSSGLPGTTTNSTIGIEQTYDMMKKLLDSVDVGFRFLRGTGVSSPLAFQFYKGTDRSASQDAVNSVLFDPELDNIEDVKSFLSTRNYIPRIWAHQTSWSKAMEDNYYYENYYNLEPYYRPGTLPGDPWGTRYAIFDLEGYYDPTVNVPNDVETFIKAQLSQKKVSVSIDGKIVPTQSSFKAGTDYFLGDLVSYRFDSDTVDARVTEIITSVDIEGEKIYPTLSFAESESGT